MRIVVTGATGLVGKPLVRRLVEAGHDVSVLSRDPARAAGVLPARCRCLAWDPDAGTIAPEALAGSDAVVHLAGAGVADGRWTAARKAAIRDSRIAGSRHLVAAIAAVPQAQRPSVLVSASAIGVYGDRGDEELDEASAPGSGFLADVCLGWEREALRAGEAGLRVAVIRIGVVLGREGGALARMLPLFRLGAGGRLGAGDQWMSWIHLDDLVALLVMAVENGAARGVINGVAPGAVTNAEFTRILGQTLGRPTLLPTPALALRLAFGEMATILLGSQRVQPRALERVGFSFRRPVLVGALADLCGDHVHEVEYEQWVPQPPEAVFPFFADAHNLETITPPFLRFSVREISTDTMGEGTRLRYRLRLRGIPIGWRSVIESWQPPWSFVDRQTRGPYKHWHHTHQFESWKGGTVIRDRIRYEVPCGALGELVAGAMVARDVASIFAFRRARIAALFGARRDGVGA